MFITVRYGDGEQTLFNPQCKISALLEDIKRRCKCTKDALVDLSDESGNLKFLVDHPLSYASEILKERESFVLIRIEKKSEDEGSSYTPLLNDISTITAAFLERLSKCESDATTAKQSAAKTTSPTTTPNKKGNTLNKAKAAFMSNPARLKSRDRSFSNKSPTLKKASR
ncbi:uncharacterized protein CXorf65 homolog isoform X1 [Exaiptasia diaphana]|uniref:Uncharacterized protein n=1 Tax=Exaiptasia diaphana TaxID=2652724 RepID=A0A913XS72_EXADI|nr:uncharacterized protein CXorf65 homolog isoform X1 [Exaiptasia diaphana]KXJ24978.1 Uncharacterized protein CXorf65-like [Exaiptasia diaphana]